MSASTYLELWLSTEGGLAVFPTGVYLAMSRNSFVTNRGDTTDMLGAEVRRAANHPPMQRTSPQNK